MTRERVLKLVEQQSPTTCGQACLAMIFGCTLQEAIDIIGHDGITSDDEILKAMAAHSRVFEGLSFTQGKTPDYVIAIQKHREPNGTREHWTVSEFGLTLDPAKIGRRLWPVYQYAAFYLA